MNSYIIIYELLFIIYELSYKKIIYHILIMTSGTCQTLVNSTCQQLKGLINN